MGRDRSVELVFGKRSPLIVHAGGRVAAQLLNDGQIHQRGHIGWILRRHDQELVGDGHQVVSLVGEPGQGSRSQAQ